MTIGAAFCLLLAAVQARAPADSLAQTRIVGPLGMRLDAQLTRFAEYGFSGSVLVVRDGQVVLAKGYGMADVERAIRNTVATRFEMNSLTKMFTGAAVLQLEALGKLRVTHRVEQYLGAFPPDKRDATIDQLASHTSGLVVAGALLANDSRAAFVNDVKRTPREAAPGSQYRYSNAGFSILAALIEQVSGRTFEQYIREALFEPAAMRSAIFRDDVPLTDTLFAHGYVGSPAGLEAGPPNPYVWGTRGAGGVWSTVGDIYRWIVAVETGKVLPDAQRLTLFAPHRPPALEAYGWHVDSTPDGKPWINKGGGSDDFASQLLYYPRDRVTIVWASNSLRQRWRQTLNRALPPAIFGGATVSLPPVLFVQPAVLTSRVGRYLTNQDTLQVLAGDGYLYIVTQRPGVPTNVMYYPQGNYAFTGFDPATVKQTRLVFGNNGSLTVEGAGAGRIVAMRAPEAR